MDRTGHRSVQGVRKYKRPSSKQLSDISNILNPPKLPKSEQTPTHDVPIHNDVKCGQTSVVGHDECSPGSAIPTSELFTFGKNPSGQFFNCVFNLGK